MKHNKNTFTETYSTISTHIGLVVRVLGDCTCKMGAGLDLPQILSFESTVFKTLKVMKE